MELVADVQFELDEIDCMEEKDKHIAFAVRSVNRGHDLEVTIDEDS